MEKMLGTMIDCSRNAVMNVATVKKYAQLINAMGYNTLMLYTEDTYDVDNNPYFGHFRGRYSKDEIREIDAFCREIGIELIPCIQTLAHLDNMFKWASEYDAVNDCDNILLAGDEKTYELIDDMISSVSQCFTSKKIHIGMDEAHRVGTGKYQKIHGIRDRFDIINEHLHKVCDIVKKYGFKPMIWSDMFCQLAMDIDSQYDFENDDTSKILEKSDLPDDISLVYWNYYETNYDKYVKHINTHKIFNRNVLFAGGAATWHGFAPDNSISIKATEAALKACNDCNVDGILITEWGDDGAECSLFAAFPALMYAAEAAKGNTDILSIKAKFKEITGCDFDSFMLLDKLDKPDKNSTNPSKYLFYNDLFMGIRDFMCPPGANEHYKKIANTIRNIKDKGSFDYMFDSYEKLASVLSIKAELGIKTRTAYLDKDIDTLTELINDYSELIEKLNNFHASFQKRWFTENKPQGFEVQDIRIGGLIQRTISCKNRLIQFVNGEINEISELDEPMMDKSNDAINGNRGWARLVTANTI